MANSTDMRITVKRIFTNDQYTIGHLYINGKYYCDTLEDADRCLDSGMTPEQVKQVKSEFPKKTAIPIGIYKLTLTYSPRFKKIMPLVNGVPGFEGIRIHPGNTDEDTEGCLLVGLNKVKGRVTQSRIQFDRVMRALQGCKGKITIEYSRNYYCEKRFK